MESLGSYKCMFHIHEYGLEKRPFQFVSSLDHYHHGFIKPGFAIDHYSIDKPENFYSKGHVFELNV